MEINFSVLNTKHKDNVISRLDARVKILMLLTMSTMIFLARDFTSLFFVLVPVLILSVLAGVKLKTYIKSIFVMAISFGTIFLVNMFAVNPKTGQE